MVNGLTNINVQQATGAWQVCGITDATRLSMICLQMLTESQMQAFISLRETVSANMNYHKYRLELRNVHITPCIPCLCKHSKNNFIIIKTSFFSAVVLKDLSLVEKDHSDHLPAKTGVLNFQKWRQLAKIVQDFHQHQQSLYSLEPLEVSKLMLLLL